MPIAALAFLGLLVATGNLWLPLVGALLVVQDQIGHADAVVPLAGERVRVSYGAALYRQGYATWFAVTDMVVPEGPPPKPYADLVKDQAVEEGVPAGDILIAPGVAADTYTEALDLRRLSEEQGWRSLLVITSAYHTRRARLILADVFHGTGIAVSVRAVPNDWYTAPTWWKSPRGRLITGEEYLKLTLFFLGYHRLVDSSDSHGIASPIQTPSGPAT